MINLGREDNNEWLLGPRDADEWFTGLKPTICPGKEYQNSCVSLSGLDMTIDDRRLFTSYLLTFEGADTDQGSDSITSFAEVGCCDSSVRKGIL
jgi:hypothetical protein